MALNNGVGAALADGADYVLNVDQDTDLPADYVAIALGIFADANAVTRLGIVCVDAVNGAPALPTWVSPEGFGLVPEAIQTGFVISRECLEVGGLFDERLVIDCVNGYCLRVRDRGFRIAVAKGTDIRHSIGRRAELRPSASRCAIASADAWRPTSTTRRSAATTSRATTSTWILRNVGRRPRWVAAVLRREMVSMIVSMVSGPQRVAQVLAITTGTVHGLVRPTGHDPRLAEEAHHLIPR